MNVFVDVGNTKLKLAYFSESNEFKRISLVQFEKLVESVTKVVYSAVSQSAELEHILTLCQQKNINTVKVKVTERFGQVLCGYPKVDNLGIDRWLAVLGARYSYVEQALVIVDAGTATTIDVCIDNTHQGGWIVPGITLMQSSIIDKAPNVFSNKTIESEVFGTDTPSALFHGIIFATVGMIEQAIKHLHLLHQFSNNEIKIILTGGNAKLISEYLTIKSTVDQDLVFVGLKKFA